MLQWMGGSRKKIKQTRNSLQTRQRKFFEQRRNQHRDEAETQNPNTTPIESLNPITVGNSQSLDILGLERLCSVFTQPQAPDGIAEASVPPKETASAARPLSTETPLAPKLQTEEFRRSKTPAYAKGLTLLDIVRDAESHEEKASSEKYAAFALKGAGVVGKETPVRRKEESTLCPLTPTNSNTLCSFESDEIGFTTPKSSHLNLKDLNRKSKHENVSFAFDEKSTQSNSDMPSFCTTDWMPSKKKKKNNFMDMGFEEIPIDFGEEPWHTTSESYEATVWDDFDLLLPPKQQRSSSAFKSKNINIDEWNTSPTAAFDFEAQSSWSLKEDEFTSPLPKLKYVAPSPTIQPMQLQEEESWLCREERYSNTSSTCSYGDLKPCEELKDVSSYSAAQENVWDFLFSTPKGKNMSWLQDDFTSTSTSADEVLKRSFEDVVDQQIPAAQHSETKFDDEISWPLQSEYETLPCHDGVDGDVGGDVGADVDDDVVFSMAVLPCTKKEDTESIPNKANKECIQRVLRKLRKPSPSMRVKDDVKLLLPGAEADEKDVASTASCCEKKLVLPLDAKQMDGGDEKMNLRERNEYVAMLESYVLELQCYPNSRKDVEDMASECWAIGAAVALQERNSQYKTSNVWTLLGALKACNRTRNLERGKQIHEQAAECGHDCNVSVANALVRMYAKCGCMVDARKVFDCVKQLNVVSWNVLILGYAENGQGHTALDMFSRMRIESLAPNSVTFVAALKACTLLSVKNGNQWANCGKKIQNVSEETGCNSNVYVQSSLIGMYAKCRSMEDARQVFDNVKHPNVVSWNALILGYVENGQAYSALDMFTKMKDEGPEPDSITLLGALKACTSLAAKEGPSLWAECRDRGKELHHIALKNGCSFDVYVQNTLVDMYTKCGSMVDAQDVFDRMKHPTVETWTALILGYAENGQGHTALDKFTRMRRKGPAPDYVTLLAALKACTSVVIKEGVSQWAECRDKGKEIHNIAVENGCNSEAYFRNTLIDLYTKCGSMVDACEVFDGMKHPDVVSWNLQILGYADNDEGHTALRMFSRMRTEGPAPNSVTMLAALKACTALADCGWAKCRERCKEIHNIAVESGSNSNIYVQNTLIDMYAKCGSMVDSRATFDSKKHPDVVSWTALIMGYADNGEGGLALHLFTRMRIAGHAPNSVTFGAALKACGLVGALEFGKAIHSELVCRNVLDVTLVNCLIDFYAKCGNLVEAQKVFDLHPETRDMITWNALLAGFSSCGDNEAMFELFEGMQDAGFRPDGVTFLCILTCCSHAGLVVKGKECFDVMSTKYGIVPTVKHYSCMIDLFGRANMLDEAMALLERMPCNPHDVTWKTILGACRKWQNVEVGKLALQSLIDLRDRGA